MTVRHIPKARLTTALPSLATSQALIALVPMTSDGAWAAEAAWSLARAAATGGRRVALVDLCLEDPSLHRPIGDTSDDGIVDAFEYGVSLARVTREHLHGTLFFIPTGSYTADPGTVLESPRWERLAAGFRAEDALLLIYINPTALARLAAQPDGVVVLAPGGYDPATMPAPALDDLFDQGIPLLAAVCEEIPAEQPSEPEPAEASRPVDLTAGARARFPRVSAPLPRPRRGFWAALAVVLLGAAAALVLILRPTEPSAGATGATDTAASTPEASRRAPPPEPPAPPPRGERGPPARPFEAETPFVLQVAAYDSLEQARQRAARLAGPGRSVLVTPVSLRSGVWYRVYLGPFASEQAAVEARAALWSARLLRRNDGMVRRAPYALELDPDRQEAAERAGLLPYSVENRLLLGAFETEEQAALAREALVAAGIPFTLVARTGSRP